MNIYVDFDDCLCETARSFSRLASDLFGIDVPYEKMHCFNLQKTFDLTDEQYDRLLVKGHESEILLSFEETPDASAVINEWIRNGHNVSIITGRPYNAYEPSRMWLDRHGLQNVRLYCFDKYGRENFMKGSDFSLTIEDYYKMHFDFAVEDSPTAFRFFEHMPELRVLVYDRPWNQMSELPSDKYTRCFNWNTIRELVEQSGYSNTVL
ncbi:MAG: 2-dehydropantoate 2-reductase [Lachnospiraceae bacterium]|nr:2-dehydropantoate 2-reductase [Lachnospiraceae bacterium]